MLVTIVCATLYLLAAAGLTASVFNKQTFSKTIVIALATLAMGLHAGVLTGQIFTEPGQNLSIGNVVSAIVLLISVTVSAISLRMPNSILLSVVYGFTAAVILFVGAMPASYIMQINMQSGLFAHVILSLLAFCSLTLAFMYALQLAYINFKLKHKAAVLSHSLPPLMSVEDMLFKLLMLGTLCLTLSLITGFIFVDDMFAKENAHKTLLSMIAWSLYCAVLIRHYKWGWRGPRAVKVIVIASFILTLGYFGSRIVKELILN